MGYTYIVLRGMKVGEPLLNWGLNARKSVPLESDARASLTFTVQP